MMVMKMGDMGSALVWIPVAIVALLVGGAPFRYLSFMGFLAAGFLPLLHFVALPLVSERGPERIDTWLRMMRGQEVDISDEGWAPHYISMAVGKAGWKGVGWNATAEQGSLHAKGFIPRDTAHNDYIFAVIAEEMGFRGSLLLLTAFALLMILGLFIAFYSRDVCGRVLASLVVALFFAHVFESIGMCVLILPITGIPMPLVSYSGTFVVTCMALLGLVQSVWIHRNAKPGLPVKAPAEGKNIRVAGRPVLCLFVGRHAMAATTKKSERSDLFPFELVRPELEKVEIAIREQVRAFDPAIEPYVAYICNTSGKRIRPALSILVGGATGGVTDDHLKIGVILELIHMATLVHDDIIDGANTRRMVPTANAKWGNICRKVGNAAREVCQGEIIQTQRRFDLTFTKADYFRVIGMKTGALFASATGLAGKLSGLDAETEDRLASYGMKLGTAYQIYDDCLDLVGSEEVVGKTLRTDLVKGKLTLPILNLLETATEAQRIKLNKRILDQEPLDLPVLLGIAEYEGAIESAVDTALDLLAQSREDLEPLGESVHADALEAITWFLASLLEKCRR